jgi:hypothetical protein
MPKMYPQRTPERTARRAVVRTTTKAGERPARTGVSRTSVVAPSSVSGVTSIARPVCQVGRQVCIMVLLLGAGHRAARSNASGRYRETRIVCPRGWRLCSAGKFTTTQAERDRLLRKPVPHWIRVAGTPRPRSTRRHLMSIPVAHSPGLPHIELSAYRKRRSGRPLVPSQVGFRTVGDTHLEQQ